MRRKKIWVAAVGLLLCVTAWAGQPKPEEYTLDLTVKMSGQNEHTDRNWNGSAHPVNVCWLHVSDGQTLYAMYMKKSNWGFWGDCPSLEVGQRLKGYYPKRGKYMKVLMPGKNGKWNSAEFTVTEKGSATTLQ
jgi:hypothetical protein